ncbi:MAG: heavy metal translocating P-type ATPase metal-binding domain-containing protein [Ignavibacteriae bacterium]|nr:heavy metal translocating P-type ATPase metal-binding domain-containing protein [Ignavibacteriota bacterium]
MSQHATNISTSLSSSTIQTCDLCGLRLPKKPYVVEVKAQTYRFCCGGCKQVFTLLNESGLFEGDYKSSDLYQTSLKLGIIGRPEEDTSVDEPTPEELKNCKELVLHVDGMWCSSCSWLIEKVVGNESGVVHSRVIYASDTAKIYYRPEQIAPEQITKRIARLGYTTSSRDADPKESWAERKSLLIKMGVALFLMNNLMMFSYAIYIGYFHDVPAQIHALFPWILFGFAAPAVFWCAIPIHTKAWQSVRAKSPTMELLFSIGIFAAFFYSTYEAITGGDHVYFDTSGGLVALLLVGKFIELSAKHKTSESINRLYQMLPKKVRVKAPEGERLVSIEKLNVGERFIVKAGEKIPADGVIVTGRAVVDESLLTGESKPIEKSVGSSVVASSMNVNGILEIEAQRIGNETTLSSIIRMVERALTNKSALERTVDRISRVFIPAVLAVSFLTGAVLLVGGAGIEAALLRAITVLVVACPCVLGMATPLAVAAGIGYAAKHGVLIRDAAALQQAGKISTVVFDKTGTLTDGTFTLLAGSNPMLRHRDLQLASSLEQASNHPIALARVHAARSRGLQLFDASDVRSIDGMGIDGRVNGTRVVLGNEAFVRRSGYSIGDMTRELADREAERGHTVVFCGIASRAVARHIVLGDSLKAGASESVAALKKLGITTRLLSGDMEKTTAAVARLAGIAQFSAQALPSDKIETIKRLQAGGSIVAMVGDGVNDAPALAQADVGIAIGSGAEIAIESAPIALLRDDIALVAEAVEISRRTTAAVRQNLAWAFLYNVVGIVLAVLGLLNPFIAAIAMLASSISVVLNSMRVSHPKGLFTQRMIEILFPWIERE